MRAKIPSAVLLIITLLILIPLTAHANNNFLENEYFDGWTDANFTPDRWSGSHASSNWIASPTGFVGDSSALVTANNCLWQTKNPESGSLKIGKEKLPGWW